MSIKPLAIVIVGLVALVLMPASLAAPLNDTNPATNPMRVDAKAECAQFTGWPLDHIDTSTTYNDGCAVVCVVRGKDSSFNIRQGQSCYDDNHICYDGSCYEKSQVPKSDGSEKVYATIKILGASVRDADPWPLQGGSDPFAVVEELTDGPNRSEPSSTLFCHTKTIQDTNSPKWMHTCRTNPLGMRTKLRFSVYDSDRPAERPDKLGSVTVTLKDIADGEPHTLSLSSTGPDSKGSYIKVSISINKKTSDEGPIN